MPEGADGTICPAKRAACVSLDQEQVECPHCHGPVPWELFNNLLKKQLAEPMPDHIPQSDVDRVRALIKGDT